jgi:tetratricopeptide (TPR) repeat protein
MCGLSFPPKSGGCYTEVAMNAFLKSTLLLSLVLLMTGCGELLITSRKSNEKGMEYYNQRNYNDAAGAFSDAIRQEPRDYQSQFYLGVCYDQLKQYQDALRQYRVTLDVMDKTIEGINDDKFRLIVMDTYAGAIARYDTHELELNDLEKRVKTSNNSTGYFLLGKTYRLRGDADNALSAYIKAADLNPTDFNIRKELGLYLLDPLGQNQKAAYYLQQAYQLKDDDEAVNNGLNRLGIKPQIKNQSGQTPAAGNVNIQQVSLP